jgi:hypothetical protein
MSSIIERGESTPLINSKYETMPYRDMQIVAKTLGIKANLKEDVLRLILINTRLGYKPDSSYFVKDGEAKYTQFKAMSSISMMLVIAIGILFVLHLYNKI